MKVRTLTRKQKDAILEREGYVCYYCQGRATVVDHITPWSYTWDDNPSNLMAACQLCNSIAYNKVFSSLAEKWNYLRKKRMRRMKPERWPRAICPCCDCAFAPGVDGASNVLCGVCYEKQTA